MKYVGSKNKIAKHLKLIIESFINNDDTVYIEPFVGGANVIDKIECKNKIGCDINEYLIALLDYVGSGGLLPETISEEQYLRVKDGYLSKDNDIKDWYVGLTGFGATFGAKWFGGYARGFKADKVTPRDIPNESIRNLRKQQKSLKGIKFLNIDYRDISAKNAVIYCDPPYEGTTKYKDDFNHEDFWDWARYMSIDNTVLISEYNAPDDFVSIWEMPVKTSLGSGVNDGGHQKRTEKLFKLNV